jgi:hypothetical protein
MHVMNIGKATEGREWVRKYGRFGAGHGAVPVR